jgi:hypothetical protein
MIDRPRFDRPRAIAALERFVELTAADRRDRATRRITRATAEDVRGVLKAQSVAFRRGMVGLKPKFQDPATLGQVWPGDWIPYFDQAAHLTRAQMTAGLFDNILSALWVGGGHLVDDVGSPVTIAFNLENPRAVSWAAGHAAEQVRRINDATKEGINRVIVNAVENGHSYTRTAEALRSMYEFSPGRAKRIAVYEIGSAYEQGKKMAAQELTAAGLQMEKKWQSAGDDRVRPTHRENQAAGWIPMDELFPSGDDIPPADSGCRCVGLWRMAK